MVWSLQKEVLYYQQEVIENETKLQEMKDQQRNVHDIKKFEEVLGESRMMIPDSKSRLDQALSDLTAYLTSDEVKDLETSEWFIQAQDLLKVNKSQTQDAEDIGYVLEETDVSNLDEGEAYWIGFGDYSEEISDGKRLLMQIF